MVGWVGVVRVVAGRAGIGQVLAVWVGVISVLSCGHGVGSSTSGYWHRGKIKLVPIPLISISHTNQGLTGCKLTL